jgi:hypothetical protein
MNFKTNQRSQTDVWKIGKTISIIRAVTRNIGNIGFFDKDKNFVIVSYNFFLKINLSHWTPFCPVLNWSFCIFR